MTATGSAHLATIVRYYDGCSTGDIDTITATLDPDVCHYFLAPNPASDAIRGAAALAAFWQRVQRRIDGHWLVDQVVGDGRDRAVIEWSLYWTRTDGSPRVITRGAEWFEFRDGRISEIRSYYQQHPQTTELSDFAYEARGYSRLGAERSAIHPGVR